MASSHSMHWLLQHGSGVLAKQLPLAVVAAAGFSSYSANTKTSLEAAPRREWPVSTVQRKMTAIGHFSVLSETQFNPSIVTFFMTLRGQPMTATDFRTLWKDRDMPTLHPRFHSVACDTLPGYFRQHMTDKAAALDAFLRQHVTETLAPAADQYFRADLTARIQALQTVTWPLQEALWHVYVATSKQASPFAPAENGENNAQSIILFRGHHALADGASMGAALMDLCDEAAERKEQIKMIMKQRRGKRPKGLWNRFVRMWKRWLWFCAGSVQSLSYQMSLYVRQLWDADPWELLKEYAAAAAATTQVESKGDTVAASRSISWTKAATVDQTKWIATTLGGPKTTVNDVFVSCVTAALAKQLAWHRRASTAAQHLPRQMKMNVAVPVHLTGGVILPGASVSNQLGAFCVRLPGELDANDHSSAENSTTRLQTVHDELYKVKRTPMPLLSHWMARSLSVSMNVLPASWAPWLFHKANAGAVAVVTNVRGAPTTVHMGGRRVESIHGFVPLPPGIPVGVVVSSYAGDMSLTVTAEPWAVPDADQFLKWVLEEYMDLLKQAKLQARR